MAVTSRGRVSELQIPKKWKDAETSPERTKVWTEPTKLKTHQRKVPVLYYLSRNGQLEHPHFMEVPLSSPQGLHLKDVINRLNALRGKGMGSLYSWSSKRSYKNGFVWHDLLENDLIYPAHGQEYILKGSEIVDLSSLTPMLSETASSRSLRPPEELQNKSPDDSEFPGRNRRRNQSWSSIDLNEYRVYKSDSFGDSSGRVASDASTQTDDKRRRRRANREEKATQEIEEEKNTPPEICQSTELSREDISPPPSDSSPETLETLMKADKRLALTSNGASEANLTAHSGRMKAASVLMQLLTCGAISFKECGPTAIKDSGLSLIGHSKSRLPGGGGSRNQVGKQSESGTSVEFPNLTGPRLEDKEYFSGSLIETKKGEVPALKRSSSYNADGSSRLQFVEQEIEGVRARCLPRKPKTLQTKKDASIGNNGNSSQPGSKRIDTPQKV